MAAVVVTLPNNAIVGVLYREYYRLLTFGARNASRLGKTMIYLN